MSHEEQYPLVLSAEEISGNAPVFVVGDKIVAKSPKIVVKETDDLCIHAFGLYSLNDCSFKL